MSDSQIKNLLIKAIIASQKAGKAILKVYESNQVFAGGVEYKPDNSPLTIADKNAHTIIVNELSGTKLPVLSEEGKDISYRDRKNWQYFWLVDPLDGTKEFIKRNGEFTVNIALIHDHKPVIGVIYEPVKDILYFACKEMGAFKISEFGVRSSEFENVEELILKAESLPLATKTTKFTIIASRSHMSEQTQAYINELQEEKGDIDIISAGSALKLCLVAEGKADVYPRFAPTMEWDTAAGQAIVEEAGGQVLMHESGEVMLYNRENLVNGWFIVTRKKNYYSHKIKGNS
ncbi:MAG: 3'(2'),5'-bisphosphate nucleotidase CysQ [Bacteroidota bacterium]